MQRHEGGNIDSNVVHPAELIVYSLLSNDLDGVYQSINDLRESQALLILMLRKIKNSLKEESQLLYDRSNWKGDNDRLDTLKRRVDSLRTRFWNLKLRSDKLGQRE
ncbi:bioproteinsis of lysosome- organelles complex 1 subunit snn1 [Zygosaccharomyces mellis]|uniref:Bioproteinsis of lysosome-organelles complex 1 subunit snn1 n=1 Tax=Zygosaccharomyces mellis TaxID=42258 RepID=A0A4C2E767_9SACH|nr:bioproteinsis of lysosome- organelles complex 1 subunit snn1 [Zygosaccharomyces mellis]